MPCPTAQGKGYLYNARRQVILLGLRLYTRVELDRLDPNAAQLPTAADIIATNALLTLCDRDRNPYIQDRPIATLSREVIGNASPTFPGAVPMIPLVLAPRITALDACYVEVYGTAYDGQLVWEIVYRDVP